MEATASLSSTQQAFERLQELATAFGQTYSARDQNREFPAEEINTLKASGLLALPVPQEYGGLGASAVDMARAVMLLAEGNPSVAQMFAVHCILGTVFVRDFASEAQKKQLFRAIIDDNVFLANASAERQAKHLYAFETTFTPSPNNDGVLIQGKKFFSTGSLGGDILLVIGMLDAVFTAYGSEPPMVALGQPAKATSTVARRVDGGYIINGQKYYATNAGAARYAMLAVMVEGGQDALDGMILPLVEDSTPGVSIEPSWWSQATGMRATVSHLVKFKDVFVPDQNLLGNPGDYIRYGIQAKLLPQFASNFVGCAEAAYEFALAYLKSRNKLTDPYIQHYVAEMHMTIQSMTLWLHHTAWLWQTEQTRPAQLAAHMYRVVAEEGALKVVQLAIKACGASATMSHYPLERIHRDLTFYARHENADALKATVGKAELGAEYDASLRDFLNYAVGAPKQWKYQFLSK